VNDIEALLDKLVLGFGSVFQDAVAWAAGIGVESAPMPWFQRVDEYGERAWRLVGENLAVVCWDCGNGWMDILTLEPLRTADPAEFRAAAVEFYSRLEDAIQNPNLNGG
jgi:hypothetical protein